MKVKKKSLEHSLDFIGILASLVCAIHCIAMPFVLTISILGNLVWFSSPQLEGSFITFSIVIAAGSLLWSFFQKHRKVQALWIAILGISLILIGHIKHGADDHWLTAFGGILLATAHALNWLFLQGKFQRTVPSWQLLALSVLVAASLTYKFTQQEQTTPKNQEELLELVWQTK